MRTLRFAGKPTGQNCKPASDDSSLLAFKLELLLRLIHGLRIDQKGRLGGPVSAFDVIGNTIAFVLP
jgi:hypothetical protein